jgi:hypothetical protein
VTNGRVEEQLTCHRSATPEGGDVISIGNGVVLFGGGRRSTYQAVFQVAARCSGSWPPIASMSQRTLWTVVQLSFGHRDFASTLGNARPPKRQVLATLECSRP